MARWIECEETALTITVYVDGLDSSYSKSDRRITWEIYDDDGDLVGQKSGRLGAEIESSPSVTFKNLAPDSKYEIWYRIYTDSGSIDVSDYTSANTNMIEPYIWDIDVDYGKEDVRIYWDCDEYISGKTTFSIFAQQQGDDRWWPKKENLTRPPSSYTSISVDKYNVKYRIKIIAYYQGEEQDYDTDSFTVPPISPGAWEWTTQELRALKNKGTMSTITATRWNSFISWLNDVIGYCAAMDDEDYSQIPSSAKLGSDKILYADDWNAIDYYSRAVAGYSHSEVEKRLNYLWKLYYWFNRYYE